MSSMLCGLLGIVIAAAHCPQHLPLRADRFGLETPPQAAM